MIDNFHIVFMILLLQEFSSTLTSCISSVICLFLSLLSNTNKRCLKDLENAKEILSSELSGISMMDEFAKHAKLKRKIDAIDKQIALERTKTKGQKTIINLIVKGVLSVCLHLYLVNIMYHYSSTSVFKLNPQFTAGPILKYFTTMRLKTVASAASNQIEVGLVCWFMVSRSSIKMLRKTFTGPVGKLKKYLKPEKQLTVDSLD